MIAMQYRFTLPADYDMGIVDRRIADRAPLLDGFPGMRLKAYLTARLPGDDENCYGPFYVWDDAASMNAFLCGAPFAGVSRAFGWPSVRLWSVWAALVALGATGAAFATQEESVIPAHADLARLQEAETQAAAAAVADGALAAVAAFDPTGWSHVRLRLWPTRPSEVAGQRIDRVGYTSLGGVRGSVRSSAGNVP